MIKRLKNNKFIDLLVLLGYKKSRDDSIDGDANYGYFQLNFNFTGYSV